MATVAKRATNGTAKSALSLLQSAERPGPSRVALSPFIFDGDMQDAAGQVLDLMRQSKEIERDLELARDTIRRGVDPWYHDRLTKHGHESSVKVPATGNRILRVTFQHRYTKLPATAGDEIQATIGEERFARYFQPTASLKVRKEIADDPERLTAVVERLGAVLGDEFASIFEAELGLMPTKAFTERRWSELDPAANERIDAIGVKQIVAMAEGK